MKKNAETKNKRAGVCVRVQMLERKNYDQKQKRKHINDTIVNADRKDKEVSNGSKKIEEL